MATRAEREARDQLNKQHQEILSALLTEPPNAVCADCRAKDPRWASWNLGIFVCIECSGIHRSVGTHISKVKSTNLDTWTNDQVENMVRWGNERANWYWEANMPAGAWRSMNRSTLIRAKYERKEWAAKSPIDATPPPRGAMSSAFAAAAEDYRDVAGPAAEKKKKKKKKVLTDDNAPGAAAVSQTAPSSDTDLFAGLTTAEERNTEDDDRFSAGTKGPEANPSAIPRLHSNDDSEPSKASLTRRPTPMPRVMTAPPSFSSAVPASRPGTTGMASKGSGSTSGGLKTVSSTKPTGPTDSDALRAMEDLFMGMTVYPSATEAAVIAPATIASKAPAKPATASSMDDLLSLDLNVATSPADSRTGQRLAQSAAPKPVVSNSDILALFQRPSASSVGPA